VCSKCILIFSDLDEAEKETIKRLKIKAYTVSFILLLLSVHKALLCAVDVRC
jgi:hypothetical protein